MSDGTARRSGGRPTAKAAILLETAILDQATMAFLADGYAATTIESIARRCGVAKRTIYARWTGKPALFRAVLERLMAKWLSSAGNWTASDDLEAALNEAGDQVLAVALSAEAVALHRLLIAESGRFPELPLMLSQTGAHQGTLRIAALLDRAVAAGTLPLQDTVLSAEQFLHLLLAGPQRRALGLGAQLDRNQVLEWRKNAVALFLRGIESGRLLSRPE